MFHQNHNFDSVRTFDSSFMNKFIILSDFLVLPVDFLVLPVDFLVLSVDLLVLPVDFLVLPVDFILSVDFLVLSVDFLVLSVDFLVYLNKKFVKLVTTSSFALVIVRVFENSLFYLLDVKPSPNILK